MAATKERVIFEIPRAMKRDLAKTAKDDRLTITDAMKRMVSLYLTGKLKIADKRRIEIYGE